jgi:hypothetical protein
MLIYRTIAVERDEYFNSIPKEFMVHLKEQHLRFPDYVWVTEISIPELFWINKKKVGEVVLAPPSKHSDEGENAHVILARLPGILIFAEKKGESIVSIRQSDIHHSMIVPKGIYSDSY